MDSVSKRLGAEQGMILVNTLLLLSLLVIGGVGVRMMMQSEYRIANNLRGSTEAFYIAEAGIAWSKEEILRADGFPASGTSRAHSYSSGGFAVSFLSTTMVTPLSAKIVARSIGTFGSSSQTVQVQLTKTYDLADGAAVLRGEPRRVAFAGNPIVVFGTDYDPASAAPVAEAKPRAAFSVSTEAARALVEQELADRQSTGNIAVGPHGRSIAQSGYLPSAAVARLAADLCRSPEALVSTVAEGAVLSVQGQNWGSRSAPQLRCFEGLAGAEHAVNLAGVAGAGVLVVREASLSFSGALQWEGLVIVSGSRASVKVTGEENKEIYGSLMINETGQPGSELAIMDIQGSVRLLFSRSALNRAATKIPRSTLEAAYGSLPATVTQNYWRAVASN